MQKKEIKSTRDKEIPVLMKEASEIRLKINKSKIDMKVAKEKNLKKVSHLTRDLSQILTIIREKELAEKETKNS